MKKPSRNAAFFVERRRYLLELDDAVLSTAHAHEAYERDVLRDINRDRPEYEDHRPRLSCVDAEDNTAGRDLRRVAFVDAVLEKIEDGSYGFSDVSGRPIPERLETAPDAISTWDEKQASAPDGESGRIQ